MNEQTVLLQPANVIHIRDYRDTSLIVELLTADHGRIAVIAKGAKSGKSRQAGELQPFQPLLVSWRCRSDLGLLTHVEADGVRTPLDTKCLMSCFYLNELIMRSVARGDHLPRLFHTYRITLTRLSLDPESLEGALRVFEKHLLDELGYGLLLSEDEDGEPIGAEHRYRYMLNRGPVFDSGKLSNGIPISGRSLLSLEQEQFCERESLVENKQLLQAALLPIIGGSPLKSREMYRQTILFQKTH